jgi:hypothetical protein
MMRSTSAADRNAQSARPGKLSAAERRSLNQALAKALAFRDAGKMPEAREWAAELVRLMTHRPFGAGSRLSSALSEPAFYEPCVALHARLEAAQFGAERLADDGAVADREILRQAGLPVPPH